MAMIDSSIQYLKGVGPAFAKKFEKLGVTTIRELLLCYPRKYIDYTKPYTVVSAPYDVDSCVRATVLQKEPVRRIKGWCACWRRMTPAYWGCPGSTRPTWPINSSSARHTTSRAASAAP